MIMEGLIVFESDGMLLKCYGLGDVVFFCNGVYVKWYVEGYVKKIVFCCKINLVMIGFLICVVNKLKKIFVFSGECCLVLLMGVG